MLIVQSCTVAVTLCAVTMPCSGTDSIEDDRRDAVALANVAASLSVPRLGAQASMTP